jgi:cold shock protein
MVITQEPTQSLTALYSTVTVRLSDIAIGFSASHLDGLTGRSANARVGPFEIVANRGGPPGSSHPPLDSLVVDIIVRGLAKEMRMAKGTVKWFNPTKGYGFIQPQGGGGKDVFVHISAVEKAGLSTLNEGQVVEYEEVPNKGKTSAENLKV